MTTTLRRCLRNVTVEPMSLLYCIAQFTTSLAIFYLMLEKFCHPDANPNTIVKCPNEIYAQKESAKINSWRPLLEYGLPILFVVFAGAWSDSHGNRRKPLMLIPIVGEILTNVACLLHVYNWALHPWKIVFIQAILRGMCGGRITHSIGVNSYIVDITTLQDRTIRLGIATAITMIGLPVSLSLSGFLRRYVGFFGTFSLSLCLNVIALILGQCLVKNTQSGTAFLRRACDGLFDLSVMIESFKTVLKPREGLKRFNLLLMIATSPLYIAVLYGEGSLLFFYLRLKFHWDEVHFGLFCSYKTLIVVIGNLISLRILSTYFGLSDAVIGAMATVTQSCAALGNAFASRPWHLFVFPAVDIMHGCVDTVGRSIASKCVCQDEISRVYSVIAIMDSSLPLLVFPLYNLFYRYSLDVWPGSFFLLSAVIPIINLILFISSYILSIQKVTRAQPIPQSKDNLIV